MPSRSRPEERFRPVHAASILTLTVICAMSLISTAQAQTLPVQHKNSIYTLTYLPDQRRLDCSSNNTECVWQTTVATNLRSFRDFAAIATAAGPVIVYSTANHTYFKLLHFRDGSSSVPQSGEPLSGSIGEGWLLNCIMQPAPYGAKAICQTVDAQNRIREYRWDINMYGTHKLLGANTDAGVYTAGSTARSQRYVNTKLGFSADVPQGFRVAPMDDSSVALYGPTNGLFMTVFAAPGENPIAELGEAYMAEMGVTVTHRSEEHLDNGQPALLMMGNGTVEGMPSLHAALFLSAADRTYVLSYTSRSDVGTGYVEAFMELLNSFTPHT